MKCVWLILTLCASAYGQAQAPAKGAIAGQVVNAKTGTPLKKTTVRLTMIIQGNPRAATPAAPVAPQSPQAAQISAEINAAMANLAAIQNSPGMQAFRPNVRTAETDDQGRFSFTGLDASKYRLAAERQGFLRQSYGERKYSGGGTPIVVGDGQNVKDILFRLNPQAVITGKVLDEDGEPLANVQVRAHRYMYMGGKRQWGQVANANSSDIGEFRLPDLPPGRYLVSTNPRNIGRPLNVFTSNAEPLSPAPDMTYAATYYPSTTTAATAMPIDVGAGGEIRGIDIRLIKAQVWRVLGKVTAPDGGVGNGRGRGAIQIAMTPTEGPTDGRLNTTARPPDGQFEIRNVPSGSYILHAQSQAGTQMYAAAMPVQVTGNHVQGLTLNLASGGDLLGTVKLVDATAAVELKNLSVMLRPIGTGGFGFGPPQRGRVGDDLKFTIKGVPPMKFAVNVTGIPNTCYLKSVQFGGRDVTPDGLDMSAGGPIEVVISAAAAQIDAVVLDKDGKGIGNAVVAIIPKDGSNTMVQMTDENGILSAKGLKPGEYKLIAWEDVEPGAPSDPDFLLQFEKKMKSVKVDASGHEAVQLTAIPADDK